MSTDDEWFILGEDNEPVGPFSIDEIRRSYEAGTISTATKLTQPGSNRWFELPEVIGSVARGAAPAPPPGLAPCVAASPRSRAPLAIALALVVGALAAAGGFTLVVLLRPVELKQDSPQSAVATWIRLYGAKDYARLDQIMDGFGERMAARESACLAESTLHLKCAKELNDCIGPPGGRPNYGCTRSPECKDYVWGSVENCVCWGPGAKAPAAPYSASHVHAVLTGWEISAQTCKILSAEDRTLQDMKRSYYGQACELTEKDRLTEVSLKCGERAGMSLLVRQREGRWFVVGPDRRTRLELLMSPSPAGVEQTRSDQRRREDDLNKDLK